MEYCYIKFTIANAAAMKALCAIFDDLKTQKANGTLQPDAKWKSYFTNEQLRTFWSPSPEELAAWQRVWDATPVPARFTDPKLSTPWCFDSMLEAIQNGEYELVEIRQIDNDQACLDFDPQAYPFGGAESLQALIESFGHKVIGFDDGTGYVAKTAEMSPGWSEYWNKNK